MERDKAEQYVWKITEYYDHMNDLDSAIDLLNEYADQRIIEELEEVLKSNMDIKQNTFISAINIANLKLANRIQQLKEN